MEIWSEPMNSIDQGKNESTKIYLLQADVKGTVGNEIIQIRYSLVTVGSLLHNVVAQRFDPKALR
jgi:hypothetical protein